MCIFECVIACVCFCVYVIGVCGCCVLLSMLRVRLFVLRVRGFVRVRVYAFVFV